VKHAFYTKERRFCSLACAREYSELERTGQTVPKPYPLLSVSHLVHGHSYMCGFGRLTLASKCSFSDTVAVTVI
jgi:hypothetical protein